MKKRDLVTSLIVLAISLATLTEIRRNELPIGTASAPEAGFFPLLIVIFLAMLSLVLLVKALTGLSDRSAPSLLGAGGIGPLVSSVAVLFLYGFLLQPLGYLICTFLLITFFLKMMGRKKPWVAILVGLATTLATYLLFDVLLETQLPMGILSGMLGR